MGWAAGRSGTIIHTEDGGKKWTTQYNIKALPTKVYFLNEKEEVGNGFQVRSA